MALTRGKFLPVQLERGRAVPHRWDAWDVFSWLSVFSAGTCPQGPAMCQSLTSSLAGPAQPSVTPRAQAHMSSPGIGVLPGPRGRGAAGWPGLPALGLKGRMHP